MAGSASIKNERKELMAKILSVACYVNYTINNIKIKHKMTTKMTTLKVIIGNYLINIIPKNVVFPIHMFQFLFSYQLLFKT
jgi:hypothetical protein